jgi:glycosyltransferase involved in cell wall biosynthesis
MRIVYLLEDAAGLWGGVKSVLVAANALAGRGHEVSVLAKSPPPDWLELRCGFTTVPDFAPQRIPPADVVVGTYWTTVPHAAAAPHGRAVHYCQGYEGFGARDPRQRAAIEQVYRDPRTALITISPHLRATMRAEFGRDADEVVYWVDHERFRPAPPRRGKRRFRVGLVGPYQVWWKDIATGIEACRLAHAAGLDLELVRITNTALDAAERALPFPTELHERVPPARVGELFRSLDVFLGSSCGPEEGFFLPAVEAMASGVPCVLTEIPCHQGYGGNGYALFVPPRDPAAMAEALIVATTADVAGALRQNGIATAAPFTLDAHLRDLERIFARLAGAPGRDLVAQLRAEAERLAASGAVQPARRHARAALELAPDEPALWSLLAATYWTEGDRDEACRTLEHAITAGAGDAALHNDLGVMRWAAGDADGARAAFTRALAIAPGHADAGANLAALP